MNTWDQLLLTGEFAPREHILSGLSLEHIGVRPAGGPHSIYEELWHAATWQRIVLDQDDAAFAHWKRGGQFPPSPEPEDEAAWQSLATDFLAYSACAVTLAENEAWLATEEDADNPGFIWRNALEHLAVHSAYHMGKIVLLRQLLGVWSPPPEDEG